jgi:hypothetical protein
MHLIKDLHFKQYLPEGVFHLPSIVSPVRNVLLLLFFASAAACKFGRQQPDVNEALIGNWILLYPDHQRNNAYQTAVYARAQDSIVNLMGLKLITFRQDGKFQLVDSLYRQTGSWQVKQNELAVKGAGKGWEGFEGRMIGFRNDTLQLVEYIPLKGDSVRIVWFLKKIPADDKAALLFEEAFNRWRKKPSAPEGKKQLANKVKEMLEYYAVYFEVLSKESVYFIGSRAALPFRYYQHSAGLIPFNAHDKFSSYFYDKEDASKAYDILEDAYLKDRKKPFPKGENYVIEYAKFLQRVAGRIE